MADTWRETIKQMQIFYTNIKTKGEQGVTRNERQEMKNAIIDYGALQASPVHDQALDSEVPSVSRYPKLVYYLLTYKPAFREASIPSESVSPPRTTAADNSDLLPNRTQDDFSFADIDMFDSEFNLNDSDLEAAIADATQGFWVNFPGEMEIY